MKIYGRAQQDESELNILTETTIVGDPDALRDLASFLYRCAESIEDQGEEWENEEFESADNLCPQIIVFNPYLVDQ